MRNVWGIHNDTLTSELVDEGFVSIGWDDVGDWASLAGLLPAAHGQGPDGARVLGEQRLAQVTGSPGSLVVPGSGRRVVLLHLPDAVVVDTPDGPAAFDGGAALGHDQQVADLETMLEGLTVL